jgi:hypothetical protein
MAFGLNVNFSGIVGKLTNNIRDIVSSKISTVTSTIKSFSINNVTSGLSDQIQGMVGTGFNLNLSKLSGGLNFANALKDLPFPSLSNLNINSLYGLIDQNIGVNLNKFAQGLANSYKNINLDEISLGNKLSTAIDDQINSITDEAEAGIIAGKSSLVVTNELNNLSNKQIRDFYFKPETQLDYVNGLVEKQKSKIYDLSFNSVPESTIYDNQIINLQEDSIDNFLETESSLDFSFNDNNIENDITFNTESIKKQRFQISTIEEGKNPLARKVNLNRYNKEEETLNYLEFLNDDFESTQTVTFTDYNPV